MKVIFLDVDGVLNSDPWLMKNGKKWPNGHIDPSRVEILNEVIEAAGPDVRVVVSSTWRLHMTPEKLASFLEEHGFKYKDRFIDRTPDGAMVGIPRDEFYGNYGLYGAIPRGKEIQYWLDRNKGVKSFVILDDQNDMAHLQHKLVKTDEYHGLQREHIPDILQHLNN